MVISKCSLVSNNHFIASNKCSLVVDKQSATSSKLFVHSPLLACDYAGFNLAKNIAVQSPVLSVGVRSNMKSGQLCSRSITSIILRQLSLRILQ